MNDPKTMRQNLSMAEIDPGRLLQGKTPRLIDEWQLAPKLGTLSVLKWIIAMTSDNSF